MEKKRMFVIGDIHGQISMLEEILTHWQPAEEHLLFLGDLVDRGENSKASLEKVYQLVQAGQATVVKGNHDQMLQDYLEVPAENVMLYYMNGGETTVNSLLGEKMERDNTEMNAAQIKEDYPWLLPFLKSLPSYYEWGDYLFVHAGVNMEQADWKNTTEKDFLWIREGFYNLPNTSGKTIFFGHTVTATLHKNSNNNFDIWESGDGLIGLDGGAVYGGYLHAVVLEKDQEIARYSIENKKQHPSK